MFWTRPKPKIEFLCDPRDHDLIAAPQRSGKFIPEWFRRLAPHTPHSRDRRGAPAMTLKKCMPVLDAFTLGWIIPLPADVHFRSNADCSEVRYTWGDFWGDVIQPHTQEQLGGKSGPCYPKPPLKWINRWRLKVTQGYSVLFTHPLNHFDLPFTSMSGYVDCDRFPANVNFPFFWNLPNADLTLKAGTPIIQAIPIRRDAMPELWEARSRTPAEITEDAFIRDKQSVTANYYTDTLRVRK